MKTKDQNEHVFRVNCFTVPVSARAEFLSIFSKTFALMRTLPGYVSDQMFEHVAGDGQFSFVGIVEMTGMEMVAHFGRAVASFHASLPEPPPAVFARLGIKSDQSLYRSMSPLTGFADNKAQDSAS